MNLVQITPGAGGMYCGNCFRDNALVAALRRLGHETLMVPLYLPMTLDEAPTSGTTPTFFGGINVYLSQVSRLYRHAPAFVRRWLDAPALLRWAAGRAAKTRAEDVGELTVSMLRGEEGHQRRELAEMIEWFRTLPRPDYVLLSNALLLGFTRELKTRLGTRVACFLQSEESFLDAMAEPHRSNAWRELAQRARDVDVWIAPTAYFARRMERRLGLPEGRVQVVFNGIALDGYREVQRPPVAAGWRLGFFARMCPDKGLDTVVDAFIEVRRRGSVPGLRLAVGGGCGPGDEPFVAEQKAKLRTAGLEAEAAFHPNLTREQKITFLAECDLLCVPARFSEAFGLYLLEALAAGTAVLQPDVCGFREIIEATGGGQVYTPNTVAGLVQALERIEPERLRSWGETGRRVVLDRHDDVAMARGTLAALGVST